MEAMLATQTRRLLELLGHEEMPFGLCYSDEKPDGFGPKPGQLFGRDREAAGEIDWQRAFADFSCLVGNLRLARKKTGRPGSVMRNAVVWAGAFIPEFTAPMWS